MKILKYLLCLFLLGLGLTFASLKVSAEESTGENAAGFSVMKLDPASPQVNESSSFYDLLVQPGDEITIQAQITNSGSDESSYNMKVNTAFTNGNGEINYSKEPKGDEIDKSLKYKFSEIAQLVDSDQVQIPSGAQKIVSMKIKVPQDAADGVILGGWYFEKKSNDSDNESKSEGISINNRFAYSLAVKLTVKNEISKPNLNLVKIKPNLNNYRKVINANIQNDQAAVTSNLSFHGEVTKKGSTKVLYKVNASNKIMAPNSNFDLPIFLKEGQLKAGNYVLHLSATTKDTKWDAKTWNWEKEFKISASQAKAINKKAINDPKPKVNYLLYILMGIIILLLIILILVLVLWKSKKLKQRK